MKRKHLRHARKYLLRSILIICAVLLMFSILAVSVFVSNSNQSARQKILETETIYLNSLLERASSQMELIKQHCYELANIYIPYYYLTDISYTGTWSRDLMNKLLDGSDGYTVGGSIEIGGERWEVGTHTLPQWIGRYSLFDMYCEEKPLWPYLLEFRTVYTNAQLNQLSFTIDAAALGQKIFSDRQSRRKEFLLNADHTILLANNNPALFRSFDTLYPGLLENPEETTARLCEFGDDYLFISKPDYFGLRVVSMVPRDVFYQNFSSAYPYMLTLGVGLLLLSIATILFIALRFYRPINEWVRLLSLYQGDDIRNYEDELHFITEQFRPFKRSAQPDKAALYRRLSKIKEKQIAVQQHQIRFHFLFNSLENIKALSIDEMGVGNEIELSLVQLNSIISESLKLAFVIPLSQEIRLTKNYLGLMQTRFPEVEVSWDIDESLLSTRVFKFSIQPLLENCYKHAFLHNDVQDRTIEIRIYAEQEDLVIRITDNGKGISAQKLAQLRASLNGDAPEDYSEHIGIYNVHSRISMLFGADYGIDFDTSHRGTVAIIRYPLSIDAARRPNRA